MFKFNMLLNEKQFYQFGNIKRHILLDFQIIQFLQVVKNWCMEYRIECLFALHWRISQRVKLEIRVFAFPAR